MSEKYNEKISEIYLTRKLQAFKPVLSFLYLVIYVYQITCIKSHMYVLNTHTYKNTKCYIP